MKPPRAGGPPRAEVPRRGERRALSHVGGPTELWGEPRAAALLGRAFDAPPDPDAAREHVHGFHSYPARLHPRVARGTVELFSRAGATVLDPFCGSGTTLVEARLLGRRARGIDLNPLAVRLASLKVSGRDAAHRQRLVEAAARVAGVATARREKRAGASRRFVDDDVQSFDPHVLLELDGILVGLAAERDAATRSDLELVLSAMLTKVSRRAGDAAEGSLPKRIAPGFVSRFFVAKTRELTERLTEYERLLPATAPLADVNEGDARVLPGIPPRSVDLVVTSPPYPGNYDYLRHHEARLRWLGLDARALADGEIGARRHLERDATAPARATWDRSLVEILRAIERALRTDGRAILVLADSVVARRPFYNDDMVRDAAPRASLAVVARASQDRPHFHLPSRDAFRQRPRKEHAILLELARKAR